MKSSKLIQLLKVLDSQEFKQFHKYIRSPYFTNSDDVLKLFKYLRPHYPDFDSEKLDRFKAFTYLYPGKKFNAPRLRNLLLKITKIVESYLLHVGYEQNEMERKKQLAEIYRNRNLNVYFQQITNELLHNLEQQPFRDSSYYYDKYLLQRNDYFRANIPREGERQEVINSALENLDSFFAIERLRIGIELKSRKKMYADTVNSFEKNRFHYTSSSNIIFLLFEKIIELLDKEEEKIFFEIKPVFQKVVDNLHQVDQQTIIFCLLNFTFRQIAKKGITFIREAFALYQIGLKKKIFLSQNNIFPSITFLNIVSIGSGLKEFDWTEIFIANYSPLLKEEDAIYLKPYAIANLNFHRGDYMETIAILSVNKFSQPLMELNAKLLLVRAYFELSLIDTNYESIFYSQLRNYERYLSNIDNLDATKIKGYFNFIRIFKKYIKVQLKSSLTHKAIDELNELLNTLSPIQAKPWLQEKIDGLVLGDKKKKK